MSWAFSNLLLPLDNQQCFAGKNRCFRDILNVKQFAKIVSEPIRWMWKRSLQKTEFGHGITLYRVAEAQDAVFVAVSTLACQSATAADGNAGHVGNALPAKAVL